MQSLLIPSSLYRLTTHMKTATDLSAGTEPANLLICSIQADRLDREVHGTLRHPCIINGGGVYECTRSLLVQVRVRTILKWEFH